MNRQRPASGLRRDLNLMTADAAAFSVMVGIGETYLPAFVLALGMGELLSGLVAVVPMLAGAALGVLSPWAVRRFGSHHRWVVLCATAQALSFTPLVAAALAGHMAVWAVFACAGMYWASGLATGPAWNTWVGTIVPRAVRTYHFGLRARVAQFFVLSGLLVGGMLLQTSAGARPPVATFAALFAVAGLCRLLSSRLLASTSEPVPMPAEFRSVTLREMFRRFRRANDGRLILYMLGVQVSVQTAAPYFNPYMLGELKLSYAWYMTLIAGSYAAKVVASPALARIAKRFGAHTLIWIGGVGIVPISFLWVFSTSPMYLVGVQLLSGLVWAAYDLATVLLIFETVPAEERTSVLTIYNLANAVAMAGGGLIGSALLQTFGLHASAYLKLFAISSLLRALTLFLLKGATLIEPTGVPSSVPMRVLAVSPAEGSLERPILPGLSDAPRQGSAGSERR